MSDIWKHSSPQNPCPICQKPDWCQFGDRAMKCMRVESAHACPTGGWYHFYGGGSARPDFIPKGEREQTFKIDAFGIMRKWRTITTEAQLRNFADHLGVSTQSLRLLGTAWAPEYNAFAFPMKDAEGNTIGIRLRNLQGFKWAVKGSRQGVFMPDESHPKDKVAYLPEGPTDVAALLTIGLYPIGRPTCMTGNDIIKKVLKRIGIHRAVIVEDNDEMKKLAKGEGYPGKIGAAKLKKELGINSIVFTTPSPCKDVRELVRKIGTPAKAVIESEIKNRVWSKQ
jgi:hypothetical protein